jgi:hypothetical protein
MSITQSLPAITHVVAPIRIVFYYQYCRLRLSVHLQRRVRTGRMPSAPNSFGGEADDEEEAQIADREAAVEQFEAQPDSRVGPGTVHGFDSHYSYSEPERCICQPMPGSRYLYFSDCC